MDTVLEELTDSNGEIAEWIHRFSVTTMFLVQNSLITKKVAEASLIQAFTYG